MRSFVPLISAVLLLGSAPFALADKDDNHAAGHGDHGDHRGAPSAAASGVANAAASSAVAAAASAAASGAPGARPSAKIDDDGASDDEKPEQREKRHGYVAGAEKKLTDLVRAGGKRLTDDEREVVRTHWRRAMRLWRIRHLAMIDNDKAVVARVDAILARLDKQTENKLKELNGKAPADTAPAASASAAATAAAPAASTKKEGEK